jgi:RNA polymerase sigma-70 factor (ECF subfamily)
LSEPPADDVTLIDAYRRGDDSALTALVERHQTRVYRLALGVLASPQEAEDAAQEALMAMLRSLPSFRGDSRFSTWLYRLTLNTCLKRRRRRPPEQPLPPAAAAIADNPRQEPDVTAGRRWLRARVAQFLAVLPETHRVPVVLSDALGMPSSEIAAVLKLSMPNVKARLRRGRRRLRAEIERYCEEAGLSGWRELLSD